MIPLLHDFRHAFRDLVKKPVGHSSWLPARRAASISTMEALRNE